MNVTRRLSPTHTINDDSQTVDDPYGTLQGWQQADAVIVQTRVQICSLPYSFAIYPTPAVCTSLVFAL